MPIEIPNEDTNNGSRNLTGCKRMLEGDQCDKKGLENTCTSINKRQQSNLGSVIIVPKEKTQLCENLHYNEEESSFQNSSVHDSTLEPGSMERSNKSFNSNGSNTLTDTKAKSNTGKGSIEKGHVATTCKTQATITQATITLGNVPNDCVEKELVSVLSPFVPDTFVCHCVINTQNQTASVTMPSQESVEKASAYISVHSPQLKGKILTVVKTPSPVLRIIKNLSKDPLQESRVLFITVTNVGKYPVDLDVLYRVFSRYGTVEKIIVFPKPTGRCQSLIQLSSISEARNALNNLNRRDIYDGCNTLQIDYSRLSELVVNSNTSRSWDYLVAPRFTDIQGQEYIECCNFSAPPHQPPYSMNSSVSLPCGPNAPYPLVRWPNGNGVVDHGIMQHHHMYKLREQNVALFPETMQHTLSPHNMYGALTNVPAEPLFKRLTPDIIEKLPSGLQNLKTLRQINPKQTSVVICYNLPVGEITVVKLFNLFSIYGIVEKIKLLRGKESTALVQFSDPFFAALACHFLEGAPFFGVEGGLQIEMSRNFEVRISPASANGNSVENIEEAKRAAEFSFKDQRCTRDEIAKIVRGACRPTSTVFISNIPNTLQEDALREIISSVTVVHKLKLTNTGVGKKATAVAELGSEKEAVAAICNLHNHRVAQCHLKFAFTKQVLAS